MKVTPINRSFGRHKPGEVFDFPDKAARLFIKVGKLREADSSLGYQTRMMQAEPLRATTLEAAVEPEEAPYGYKADGTPRKRPGRAPSAE